MTDFKNTTLAPERLTEQDLMVRPPLELEWLGSEVELDAGKRADARIRLKYKKQNQTFIVEYNKQWTTAALETAIRKAKAAAQLSPQDLPMVVLPYLSSDAFERLAKNEVNGLDLVGRGFIYTDDWFLLMDGAYPNPFKNTQIIKSPYQGKSALVARTLLACPVLPNAEALRAEIEKRGGKVSQPVVSRALKAFRDDLIVGSQGEYSVVLLQPEKLLDRLVEQWKVTTNSWRRSENTVLWSGLADENLEKALSGIFSNSRAEKVQTVFTGLTSTPRFTGITLENTRYIYAERIDVLLDGVDARTTRRFHNIEILFPPDDIVFFDFSVDKNGLRWSSPLQAYLELITGDARLKQAGITLLSEILEEVDKLKKTILGSRRAV